jgi:hypothetical protein
MDIKKPPLAHRPKEMKAHTARLIPRRPHNIPQRRFDRALIARPRHQPHEYVLLHDASGSTSEFPTQ